MNMSVILFQIGDSRFSALAVDTEHPKHIWKARYESVGELIRSLERSHAITSEEANTLYEGSCFSRSAPVLRVTLNREDIEHAGFVQVGPTNTDPQWIQPD